MSLIINIVLRNLNPQLWESNSDTVSFVKGALEANGVIVKVGLDEIDSTYRKIPIIWNIHIHGSFCVYYNSHVSHPIPYYINWFRLILSYASRRTKRTICQSCLFLVKSIGDDDWRI